MNVPAFKLCVPIFFTRLCGVVTVRSVRVGMSMFPVWIVIVKQVKLCVLMLIGVITRIIVKQFDQRVEESLAAHGNGIDGSGDDGEAPGTSASPFMAWYEHATMDVVINSIMTVAVIIGLVAIDSI